MSSQFVFRFLLFSQLLVSCNSGSEPQRMGRANDQNFNPQKVKDQFVEANQLLMQKETDNMDAYERSHNMHFVKTNSGIRYFVYKPSIKGDSIKKGMEITMKFTVFLLDGTQCYSSDQEGLKTLIVEHDESESGIQKGLQYLKRGDKALLLIPSPLAHGLLGDLNKIPPQMPILYDVEIK